MEVNQEKITGRLCAMARVKYSDVAVGGPGYEFTSDGFKWELDPIDIDQYGITPEAINDCLDQLEEIGSFDELKNSEHIRQHQGWMNTGIAIQSKKDPRITCVATFVDMEYDDSDLNLRWFIDLNKESKAAQGPAERPLDSEELKATERAQEMTKEKSQKEESIDSLFENPFKFLQESKKKTKVAGTRVDGFGLPVFEDIESGNEGHVGVDAIEKPAGKEGDKDREEVAGTAVKDLNTDPKGDGKDNKPVDGKGQSQVGGADKESDLASAKVKPGEPDDKPKEMSEDEKLKHVGADSIVKAGEKEGDKDREEVDGKSVDVKPSEPEKAPEVMAGKGGNIGGSDKESDVASAKVKPGEPDDKPKVMSEKLIEMRKKQYEAYKAKKASKIEEARKRLALFQESKKKTVNEDYQHPVKAVESMKKHMEEAHRAVKKAHHLIDWAHGKIHANKKHLPAGMLADIEKHDPKIEEAKMKIHEAKRNIHEMCEEIHKHHTSMKKK